MITKFKYTVFESEMQKQIMAKSLNFIGITVSLFRLPLQVSRESVSIGKEKKINFSKKKLIKVK